MKKMVCEICESQKIKKENGVFICQECGTEYSLEEAKNLLKEAQNNIKTEDKHFNKFITLTEENKKYSLLNYLLLWAEYILKLEELSDGFLENKAEATKFYFNEEKYFNKFKACDFLENYCKQMPTTAESFIRELKYAFSLKRINYKIKLNGRALLAYQFYKQNNDGYSISISSMFNKLKDNYVIKEGYNNTKVGYSYFSEMRAIYSGEGISYWKDRVGSLTIEEWIFTICLPNIEKNIDGVIYEKKGVFFSKLVPVINLNPILQEISKANDEICTKLAPIYIDVYNKEFKEINDHRASLIMELINLAPKLESYFMLPYQYRKSSIIYELIKLLRDGKADTWKELINLYDTITFRDDILMELQLIKNELSNINNHLESINQSLRMIDSSLLLLRNSIVNIEKNIVESNKMMEGIRKNTFWTMYHLL